MENMELGVVFDVAASGRRMASVVLPGCGHMVVAFADTDELALVALEHNVLIHLRRLGLSDAFSLFNTKDNGN